MIALDNSLDSTVRKTFERSYEELNNAKPKVNYIRSRFYFWFNPPRVLCSVFCVHNNTSHTNPIIHSKYLIIDLKVLHLHLSCRLQFLFIFVSLVGYNFWRKFKINLIHKHPSCLSYAFMCYMVKPYPKFFMFVMAVMAPVVSVPFLGA